MKTKQFLIGFIACTILIVSVGIIRVQARTPEAKSINAVVGTWNFSGEVEATGAKFATIYQFEKDGNFEGLSTLVAPSLRTPLLGSWKSIENNEVSFKAESFTFDASNQATGSAITEGNFTRRNDTLNGGATVTFFDVNNNPTGTVTKVSLTGQRF